MPYGKRIVIIDDDLVVGRIMSDILEHLGHRTKMFGAAREGLRYVLSNSDRIRMVISDNDMPEIQGVDLLQQIRSSRPGLPLLLVSACPPRELVPGVAFLPKPFRIESLNRCVTDALAGKALPQRPGSDQAEVA